MLLNSNYLHAGVTVAPDIRLCYFHLYFIYNFISQNLACYLFSQALKQVVMRAHYHLADYLTYHFIIKSVSQRITLPAPIIHHICIHTDDESLRLIMLLFIISMLGNQCVILNKYPVHSSVIITLYLNSATKLKNYLYLYLTLNLNFCFHYLLNFLS